MSRGENRRSCHFILKWFQIRFMAKFIALLLIGLFISSALLYVSSNHTLTDSMNYGHRQAKLRNTFELLLPSLVKASLISGLIITLLGVILLLRASHHLAGPLYRFEKNAEKISSGDLTENVRLRNRDEMIRFGEKFSEMTSALNKQISDIKRDTSDLSLLAEELESKLSEEKSQEAEELARKLNEVISKIQTSTDFFKV